MAEVRYYATGRRKEAVARVWLSQGSGRRIVNGLPLIDYLKRDRLAMLIEQPFKLTDTSDKLDMVAKTRGGGISGQAGAIRLGVCRALLKYDEGLRKVLKENGLLTRDPREKERKKYGLAKRRKRFQFSKR